MTCRYLDPQSAHEQICIYIYTYIYILCIVYINGLAQLIIDHRYPPKKNGKQIEDDQTAHPVTFRKATRCTPQFSCSTQSRPIPHLTVIDISLQELCTKCIMALSQFND